MTARVRRWYRDIWDRPPGWERQPAGERVAPAVIFAFALGVLLGGLSPVRIWPMMLPAVIFTGAMWVGTRRDAKPPSCDREDATS